MQSAWLRLRKYARKKTMARRSRSPHAERYTMLYWRYHNRLYGKHAHLWGTPISNAEKRK